MLPGQFGCLDSSDLLSPHSPPMCLVWGEGRGDHQAGSSRIYSITATYIHILSGRPLLLNSHSLFRGTSDLKINSNTKHSALTSMSLHPSPFPICRIYCIHTINTDPDADTKPFMHGSSTELQLCSLMSGLSCRYTTQLSIQKAFDLNFNSSFVVQWTH